MGVVSLHVVATICIKFVFLHKLVENHAKMHFPWQISNFYTPIWFILLCALPKKNIFWILLATFSEITETFFVTHIHKSKSRNNGNFWYFFAVLLGLGWKWPCIYSLRFCVQDLWLIGPSHGLEDSTDGQTSCHLREILVQDVHLWSMSWEGSHQIMRANLEFTAKPSIKSLR